MAADDRSEDEQILAEENARLREQLRAAEERAKWWKRYTVSRVGLSVCFLLLIGYVAGNLHAHWQLYQHAIKAQCPQVEEPELCHDEMYSFRWGDDHKTCSHPDHRSLVRVFTLQQDGDEIESQIVMQCECM